MLQQSLDHLERRVLQVKGMSGMKVWKLSLSLCFFFRPSWTEGRFPAAGAPVSHLPIKPLHFTVGTRTCGRYLLMELIPIWYAQHKLPFLSSISQSIFIQRFSYVKMQLEVLQISSNPTPYQLVHKDANTHLQIYTKIWGHGPKDLRWGNTEPSAPGPHYRPWPPALRGILSRLRLSHLFPHLIQPPGNLCATTREAWFGEVKEWPSFPDHGFRYQRNPFGKYVTL